MLKLYCAIFSTRNIVKIKKLNVLETDDELFSRQSMSMSDISFLSGYGGANGEHESE